MKIVAVFLLLSAGIVSTHNHRKRYMCAVPLKYSPVCGSDGITYDNRVALECQKKADKDLTLLYHGKCSEEYRARRKKNKTVCVIPAIHAPVCGSDGQTYSNKHELRCMQQNDPDLVMVYQGPCQDKDPEESSSGEKVLCACPRIYDPVCGSNRITYDNYCELNCQKIVVPGLTMVKYGECQNKSGKKICRCTRNWAPVCGSDGQTYSNKCLLECRHDENVQMSHKGQCHDLSQPQIDPVPQSQVAPQPKSEGVCACPRILSPVCGTDGRTYANKCLLDCKTKNNPDVKMSYKGKCRGESGRQVDPMPQIQVDPVPPPQPQPESSCICNRMLQPVCGTDGQTYSNKCLLECETEKNPDVKFSSNGNCPESSRPQVDPIQQPQVSPIRPHVSPMQPQVSPMQPQVSPTRPQVSLTRSQVSPIPPQVSPMQPQVSPTRPQVSPMQPQVSPTRPQVSPTRPQVSPTRSQVSPIPPQVSPMQPQVSPARPQVSPMQPQVSPTRPQVSPTRSKVSPIPPQVSPMQPQVSPTRPQVSPTKPQVMPTPRQTDSFQQPQVHPIAQPLEDSKPMVCPCPKILLPVCGTDGRTYSNQCSMNCQAKKNPDLKMKHKGPCEDKTESEFKSESACECNRMLRPVCGTDGQTYSNKCLLDCETKKNPDLKLNHNGPCEDKTKSEFKSNDACICPMNFAPVCGSDGQTYSNECTLQCQKTKDKDLMFKHNGSCKDETKSDVESSDPCICPMNYAPICGSDGKTYPNKCTLQCEKSKNKDLNHGYDGPCQPTGSN